MIHKHFFGKTLREALEDYYVHLEVHRSANTRRVYGVILERLAAGLGDDTRVRGIDTAALNRALAAMLKPGHAEVTCESYKRTVAVFFNWLVRHGYLKRSPVTFEIVTFVREPVDVGKAITEAEIARMFAACTNRRDTALLTLFRDTGFRFGSAWHLRVEGVCFNLGTITAPDEKTDRPHTVFMSDALVEAMRAWLGERAKRVRELPSDHGYVFTRLEDGERLTYWGLFGVMRRLGKRAGVKRWGAHGFRHAWAVWAAANGVSVPETQAQLGHKSSTTTLNFYYKSPPETLRRAVNRRARAHEKNRQKEDKPDEAEDKTRSEDMRDKEIDGEPAWG